MSKRPRRHARQSDSGQPSNAATGAEHEELRRLRAESRQLREENDVMRRALEFFGKKPPV